MKRVLIAILSLAAAAAAQDQIYYKFDSVGCPTIVNCAKSQLQSTQ